MWNSLRVMKCTEPQPVLSATPSSKKGETDFGIWLKFLKEMTETDYIHFIFVNWQNVLPRDSWVHPKWMAGRLTFW